MTAYEINFDGLVGPTHHHAGLVRETEAPASASSSVSNPRKAARQVLAKMKWLADMGVKQAIFPPHERPCMATLRAFGFSGTDAQVLRAASKQSPDLLAACSTATCLWASNAATVAPSADTSDGRVHFTPANLSSTFHRSIETAQNIRTLRSIFRDERRFVIHNPVPGSRSVVDEGGANHTRLAPSHAERGLHLFIYGHRALGRATPYREDSSSYQALEASRAVARLQRLQDALTCFGQQSVAALTAGAAHNDMVCVGNENVLLYHEEAFANPRQVLEDLRRRYARLHGDRELLAIQVPSKRASLVAALQSYVFNSQIVTLAPDRMALIAPIAAEGVPAVQSFIDELLKSGSTPLKEVRYFDLREAMRHGGGPGCLRLRVVLNESELSLLPPGIFLTDALYVRLNAWIRKNYRDQVTAADLADPLLLEESRRALDELTEILGLGSIYPFQQV